MYDIVIRNGTVIDGTGKKALKLTLPFLKIKSPKSEK